MKHLLVFLIAAAVDSIWAYYIIATAEKRAFKSAIMSGIILASGAFLTLSYLEDQTYLISAILGGMLGTYYTVKYKKV